MDRLKKTSPMCLMHSRGLNACRRTAELGLHIMQQKGAHHPKGPCRSG